MKPKLLITLGCSLTKGYGSWDYSIVPGTQKIWNYEYPQIKNFEELHEDIFLKNSWPYKLQRKLGFDKLLNFGINGSSVSEQAKAFSEKMIDENFEDYDVTLIWLVTFSDRISFYKGGEIQSYNSYSDTDLYKEYINEIIWLETDTRLEMISYIKLIREICRGKKWNFLFSTADVYEEPFISEYYKKSIEENIYIPQIGKTIINMLGKSELSSRICDHPNQLGYTILCDKIYQWIRLNKPEYLNETTPEKYESEIYKKSIFNRFNGSIRLDIIEKLNKSKI